MTFKHGWEFIRLTLSAVNRSELHRDTYHLNAAGQYCTAINVVKFIELPLPADLGIDPKLSVPRVLGNSPELPKMPAKDGLLDDPPNEQFRQLIIAKNRLWFDYWRPQNWAFLAGDRVNQPSSRDHLDPSKRWFPPEREQFLPLIEAKEKEIDALAAKLAKP